MPPSFIRDVPFISLLVTISSVSSWSKTIRRCRVAIEAGMLLKWLNDEWRIRNWFEASRWSLRFFFRVIGRGLRRLEFRCLLAITTRWCMPFPRNNRASHGRGSLWVLKVRDNIHRAWRSENIFRVSTSLIKILFSFACTRVNSSTECIVVDAVAIES